jgi:hypothetical protein
MNWLRLPVLFCLAGIPAAFANLYTAQIFQTIAQTTDARYYVGEVYQGVLEWESDSPDGVFYGCPPQLYMPDGNHSLVGELLAAIPDHQQGLYDLTATVNVPELHVDNGVVDYFNWSYQGGDYYSGLLFTDTFSTFYGLCTPQYDQTTGAPLPMQQTRGTVEIGCVQCVADNASTLMLIFCAMPFLVVLRRRIRVACVCRLRCA